jgi:hypothetical protein
MVRLMSLGFRPSVRLLFRRKLFRRVGVERYLTISRGCKNWPPVTRGAWIPTLLGSRGKDRYRCCRGMLPEQRLRHIIMRCQPAGGNRDKSHSQAEGQPPPH